MSTKRFVTPLVVLALSAAQLSAATGETWSVQWLGGCVYNFKMPLAIHQEGEDTIRLDADYDAEPFNNPVYWVARGGWWRDNHAWELELIHDKLYLENGPSEVQRFSLSHGYNLLTFNYACKEKWLIWRLGAGVVIPHPESVVRQKEHDEEGGFFNTGYYVSGPVGQAAIEKRFYLYKGFFASLEGKLTVSWASVPIREGHADLWNAAMHGLVGLGYDF